MKINIQNQTAITQAIDEAQEKATARLLNYERIVEIATKFDKRLDGLLLPHKYRPGAIGYGWAEISEYEKPVGEHWGYATTKVWLKHGSEDWFVTKIHRDNVYGNTGWESILSLSNNQAQKALPHLLKLNKIKIG